jgi:sec-independent protein translocase protein TatB
MIEISLGKMVLLALIALIVLGPEKLPGAARTAGALLRRVRGGWENVRAEVERELEIEEIRRAARDAATRAEALQQDMKQAAGQVREPMAEAVTMTRIEPAAPKPDVAPAESAMAVQPELPLDAPAASSASLSSTPPQSTGTREDSHGNA